MAETSVTNQTCPTCGVEVRPNTQFCYNCGGAVAPEAIAALPEAVADLKEEKSALKPLPLEKIAEESNGAAAKPTNKLDLADLAAKPIEKPEIKKEGELKSAATMRRKSKIVQPKRVEVIWEEHENAPNFWFILAAIVLTLFAIGVFYLAGYLK